MNTKKIKNILKFNKNIKIIIFSLMILILIIIMGYIIIRNYNKSNELYIENHELYQYFAGVKVNYKGNISLKRNGLITNIEYQDIKIESDSTPIYFKKIDNEVLFPENMELIIPRIKEQSYKINYFTKIKIDTADETQAFLISNTTKPLEKAFLYNGEDLYFFPYETTINVEGIEYYLSPLSYVIVNYRDDVSIYNKENDDYKIIYSNKEDVIAYVGEYKINLSTDMIMYDNTNKLLLKNIDSLKNYM